MSSVRRGSVSLRPEAEAVWDEVRAGFALHDGFWLALLFGAQQHEIAEFAARSRDLARGRAQRVDVIELAGPDSVPGALRELVGVPVSDLFATWLSDGGGPDREPVWTALLQRLNERRDVLRTARPAAVLVGFPAGFMGRVRDTAPDLWSVRTLTATIERPVSVPPAPLARAPEAAPPHPMWFEVVAGPTVVASPAVEPLLRRAATAVGAHRVDTALLAAREALAAAAGPDDATLAHAWSARARDVQGEPLEAQRHARLALSAGRPLGPETAGALLEILAAAEDPAVALPGATALVEHRRAEVTRYPE